MFVIEDNTGHYTARNLNMNRIDPFTLKITRVQID